MQTQNIAWDLMAWSFDYSGNDDHKKKGNKSAIQLMREAACVLAQGGGFQAYYTQNRDGSIDLNKVQTMGDAARFCRERQLVSFRSTAVPQVALLLPTDSHYRRISNSGGALFPWSVQEQRVTLKALLENQYSVEIYNDTPEFLNKVNDYGVVVIADWETLPPTTVSKLSKYVQQGGSLLLMGETTGKLFDALLKNAPRTKGEESLEGSSVEYFRCGSGQVAQAPRIFDKYAQKRNEVNALIGGAMKQLFARPKVIVQGSPFVDVSLRRTANGLLAVHLVNTSGPHESAGVIDQIDPIGPLSIKVQTSRKPASVFIEPGHRKIEYTFEEHQVIMTLEKLEIHDIIVIDDRALAADWMKDAKYGCFMHFLPGNDKQFALIEQFDVNALAAQLVETGADYFVITMYQNSGYFNAPQSKYEAVTGYAPGERCARRDLILDIYNAIHPKGIKLFVYLTGQVPNQDKRAQKAYGLEQGARDQTLNIEFVRKWSEVFQEWATRYGDKVCGWWIDGCYRWIDFNDEFAEIYLNALHQGNPKAIVAFNPGVCYKEWGVASILR